ncbi:MAG TPA: AarF/UbiB family protein [Solirubrobacteraceae bacterium]
MPGSRARFVAGVLGELFADEVGRSLTPRLRSRRAVPDTETARRARARNVRLALERLGPFYVKVGQILSTRPDLVSATVISELEKLHDRVSIAPFEDFEAVLSDELGADWARRFRTIDVHSPGTASLAQVYRATLRNGAPVVVKIQRPGIRPMVLDDMALLRRASRLTARAAPRFNAVIDIESMLEVVFDAMEPELDFTAEARNMEAVRTNVERFDHLSVPDVLLATPRVLVQSLAPGVSIRDANRDAFSVEERTAIGRELLALMYRGYFVDRVFHADPHPGNIFVAPGARASLIDWGMVGRIDRRTSMLLVLVLLSLARNDGLGLAKAWIEMGRATAWADISAFITDMTLLVPKIATASLEELNFGVTLAAVLKRSTKRGIQTAPMISILGKSFGNIEGSVRYLAPELSLVEIFEDELRGVMFDLVTDFVSEQQAARTLLEIMIGSTTITDQLRGVMRDLSNRELTIQTGPTDQRYSRMRTAARWLGQQRWQ